jgi:glycine/D-amino acid oxidase-like deaminating enzyme
MRRIYPAFAYSEAPRAGCWWDETCAAPDRAAQEGEERADVVIIGGGLTGLNAALHLAQAGVGATVLEAERVGFGASGRNGGFCCLGGGMLDDATLDRKFGREERLAWRQTDKAAIGQVEDFITTRDVDVDRHSQG